MDEHEPQQQIDPDIRRLICIKSRQLAGRHGFERSEAEDIEQDLLLDYLKRSKSFDAHRCGRRTFAQLLVNHHVATIVEARRARCRDYRACRRSLDQNFDSRDDPNSPELADVLAVCVDRSGTRPIEAILNLRVDVERTLARLPTLQADLCRILMVCETRAEAATRSGMSRATLYRHLGRLRVVFAQAGLHA